MAGEDSGSGAKDADYDLGRGGGGGDRGMMKVIEVVERVVMVRVSGAGSGSAHHCDGVGGSREGARNDRASGGSSGDAENEQRWQ